MNAAAQARIDAMNARFPAQPGTVRYAVLEARKRTGDPDIGVTVSQGQWSVVRAVPDPKKRRVDIIDLLRNVTQAEAIAYVDGLGR